MSQIQITVSIGGSIRFCRCVCVCVCVRVNWQSVLSARIDGLKSLSNTQIQPHSQFQNLKLQSNPCSLKQTEQNPRLPGIGWDSDPPDTQNTQAT